MQATTRVDEAATADQSLLVVKPENDGFQVYAPTEPDQIFRVTGSVTEPQCTCAEFQWRGANNPEHICVHIAAVMRHLEENVAQPGTNPSEADHGLEKPGGTAPDQAPASANGANGQPDPTALCLRRSVSPDGRIDSLSVELSLPIAGLVRQEVHGVARKALQCQADIVSTFLEESRPPRAQGAGTREASENGNPVVATLRDIGSMQTRWGWRYFINVQVDDGTYRLIGNRRKLSDQLANAGYAALGRQIAKGKHLNVPCLATLEDSADGRYTNVVELFPPHEGNGAGR